jgi:hypothetical protein
MKKGRAGPMTHDYKLNGTTTLFAALDILRGEVIGQRMRGTVIKSSSNS